MYDDIEIMQKSVVQSDGTVDFKLPDGHIIKRGAPPENGKEMIAWCDTVREVASTRMRSKASDAVEERRAVKLRAESGIDEPAPTSDSVALVIDNQVRPAASPANPLDYAKGMRDGAAVTMNALRDNIEDLTRQFNDAEQDYIQWQKVYATLQDFVPEVETDAEYTLRMKRLLLPVPEQPDGE